MYNSDSNMFKVLSKVHQSVNKQQQLKKSDGFRCEGYLAGKANKLSHQLVNENKIYTVFFRSAFNQRFCQLLIFQVADTFVTQNHRK